MKGNANSESAWKPEWLNASGTSTWLVVGHQISICIDGFVVVTGHSFIRDSFIYPFPQLSLSTISWWPSLSNAWLTEWLGIWDKNWLGNEENVRDGAPGRLLCFIAPRFILMKRSPEAAATSIVDGWTRVIEEDEEAKRSRNNCPGIIRLRNGASLVDWLVSCLAWF